MRAVVEQLRKRGVRFEDYDLPTVKTVDGVSSRGDFQEAWFRDPNGNILRVHSGIEPRFVSGDEPLASVDVLGRAGDGGVGHEVNGEAGTSAGSTTRRSSGTPLALPSSASTRATRRPFCLSSW